MLALLLSAVTGCGEDAAPRKAAVGASALQAAAAQSGPPARAPAPVAEREGRFGDIPVTVELAPLRRRGGVVDLELRLVGRGADVTVDTDGTFDDGVAQHLTDPHAYQYEFMDSLDGVGLVDGVHGQRYAPARDHFNRCVCDRDIGEVTISRRHPVALSATFGAPPPDVQAVDVIIPRFGTIPDVPLG